MLASLGMMALVFTIKKDLESDDFPLRMYVPALFLAASMLVQFFARDRRSKLLAVSLGLLLLMLVSMVLVAGKRG